ncbi:Zinc-regulated transporter 1 [Tolypocladium capitatum]|uniref:Zinc-regulated transporter 1 n=1 Tax=Tolypocladium capitatum TaxID=45235 RepID=A0A2K3Q865_9HYPO|nr:Zinc-regulated transporter 1 [Tolypocladium capitatum]
MADNSSFDPHHVDLDSASQADVICYLHQGGNDYNGRMGARISALFVILVVSSAATVFPVLATRIPRLRVPVYAYLFARYFGSGVIIATAFIHLLGPAYAEIGPASCVGLTGGRYGRAPAAVEDIITDVPVGRGDANEPKKDNRKDIEELTNISQDSEATERAFHSQIAAFLILEFGVIFHSVIIGLNLGVAGDEFSTLYPVLVFHQSFEGLGIGARLSVIPFPARRRWMPWALCLAYGLTTPISIAIGLGLHSTYNGASYTASVVSGVLDSISAGILIYTGLVEMLARDFIFNPNRTDSKKRLALMLVSLYLGAAIMALLGKWA